MKKNVLLGIFFIIFITIVGATYAQNIVATQKGPLSAREGENITITYTVANKGNNTIYNVSVADQNFYKFLGNISPGGSQSFTEKLYIPTDAEVKEEFGEDAIVSNPYFIGGFAVTYQDDDGNKYAVNSNTLSIPLISSKVASPVNVAEYAAASTTPQGIWQQIMNLIQSLIAYIQSLVTTGS